MPESQEIFPHMDLVELSPEEVGNNLSPDELARHNELAIELGSGPAEDNDARWEDYHLLHEKALGKKE